MRLVRVRELGVVSVLRVAVVVFLVSMGFSFSAFSESNLGGIVYSDESTDCYEVELEETGYISHVEADGVSSFTIFRVDTESGAKEPVLKISDFQEARGKELPAGTLGVIPIISSDVPEDKIITDVPSGGEGGEEKSIRAKVSIYILNLEEAENEGLR